MTLKYLKCKDTVTGIEKEVLSYLWQDIHAALFSPCVEEVTLIEFKTHGKTYHDRKASLENIAIEYSNNAIGESGDLFMSDLLQIESWFYEQGKRYGLLKEFKENCIC